MAETAAATKDLPIITLVNPETGARFQYRGLWLRTGRATIQDVKRGWARFPGDKVWLKVPVGVQKQLDAGRLQIAAQFVAEASTQGASVEAMMPGGNKSHDVWFRYAVSQGMDREQASGLTRDELRARFMNPGFDPDAPPEDLTDGGKYELMDD
jgi:hypothetical protein